MASLSKVLFGWKLVYALYQLASVKIQVGVKFGLDKSNNVKIRKRNL